MTSEIRTNSLKSRAGLSTVTFTDSGPMFSGITTFVDNSTFSVGTGGTIHAPSTNTLNIGVNNTESLRIDSNSNLKVAGIVTATHFYGDGSNLTNINSTSATGDFSIADKIIHTGDTNTAIRFPAADTISFETAGNDRLRIDSSGRLGVGVNSFHDTSTRLQLQSPGSDHTGIVITAAATSTLSYIYFGDTADKDIGRLVYENSSDSMQFWTNNAERLRIDSAGRLSLGVQASPGSYPVSATARQVQAEIKGGLSGTSHNGSLAINCTNNNANLHLIRSDNNQSADVGLSNISFSGFDGTDYHVGAQISAVRDAAGGNNDIPARLVFSTTADGASTPTERLRITSGGNVNIGGNYTQTTFKAQIQTGTNKFISFGDAAHDDLSNEGSGIIFSRQSDGSKSLSGIFGHSNTSLGIAARDSLTFHAGGTSTYSAAPERLRIDSSGRLLLGTTSRGQDDADNLTIDGSGEGTGRTGLTIRSATNTFGSIFFSDATSGAGQYDGVVAYDHSTQMMRFSTASTQRVFINSSGQLLVATSSATSLGSHTGASNVSTFNQSGITLTQYGVTAGFYYDRLNFTNSQYFIVNASNTGVYLGNGATSWTGYSDERMKTNITELDGTKAYNHIKTARATSFKWNATGYPTDTKIGFIAQDWETNYPEVVNSTTETIDSVENPKGIQYTETVPVLMAALKQAITKIETLEQENIALRVRVTNLEGN